jgi:hypothetical protein
MPSTISIQPIKRAVLVRRPLIMSIAVAVWSAKYLVSLGLTHTTGPEMYGVLTAALSLGAAGANLVLLRSPRPQIPLAGALLVLWIVVAIAGMAGMVAHVIGPVPGHGPMDLRPRPIAAPLVFTALGTVGAVALVLGQRMRIRMAARSQEA